MVQASELELQGDAESMEIGKILGGVVQYRELDVDTSGEFPTSQTVTQLFPSFFNS